MLLLRGATRSGLPADGLPCVSIHAPLARSNFCRRASLRHPNVSIHAPLARSNRPPRLYRQNGEVSIHAPLARSNKTKQTNNAGRQVSIHAPLARSNFGQGLIFVLITSFQYMLLLRGATPKPPPQPPKAKFQYMLLLRGATRYACSYQTAFPFQYMLLLRGATSPRMDGRALRDRFNTCSSCEEQQGRLPLLLLPL